LAALGGLLLSVFLFVSSSHAQTLRIYHIDVEQAAATLFVAPGGKTLLVDSGKNGMGSRVKAAMDQAGATKVDYFVCTHYHEDHYGGIDDLVDSGVQVKEAYDRGDKECCLPASKKGEAAFKGYQRTVGEDAIHIRPGDTIPLDPAMTVTCLSSGGVVIGEANPQTGEDENDMSVSLLITLGSFRYFIGGDMHAKTEQKIADRDLAKGVVMYEADHHGSHTSSSSDFMHDLAPQVIVVSNGNRVDYAHPRQTTLNLYATLPGPPAVFQTNKYLAGGSLGGGNVADQFIADPETVDLDGTILATVDAGAGKCTITYGTTSHEFTFAGGGAIASSSVVIESLLPNPAGSDTDAEEVVIKNKGAVPTSITGWRLQDRSGLTWPFVGDVTLAASESRTLRRNGRPMSLNNGGDEIALIDAAEVVRDRFEYTTSTEGGSIATGH
jgi:beta-lactamase superfamily II metal-dependent hydrolase